MQFRAASSLHSSGFGLSHAAGGAGPEGPYGVRQFAAAFAGYAHAFKGASKLAHSKGFASAKKPCGIGLRV